MHMKKREYLHRLTIIMLVVLILPVVMFFISFRKYTTGKMEKINEDFYERALETYTSLMDDKIQDLERFAASISAESRESNSVMHGGCEALTENTYQLYRTVNELREKYGRRDVSEWGIYFYDIDRIITPEYAYSLDNFLYKYTGQQRENAACLDFFSADRYAALHTLFDTTDAYDHDRRCFLAGVCTRIGEMDDKVLIFQVMSPGDISDSLAIVGGEGISYFLVEDESERVLLAWGEDNEEPVADVLQSKEWKNISGVRQKILYKIRSRYPQLSVMAYVSRDSMQSSLIEWAVNIRRLLLCTIIILLIICGIAVYISYKPMHELVREFDYSGGSEFEAIRHVMEDKDSRIVEQEMLILDLLINHLIYGVPISKERIKQLGIEDSMHYYCVFVIEGYFFANSESERFSEALEKDGNTRIFVTDWHEENCSVVIVFLKNEDISGLQTHLTQWLQESYAAECLLYTGRVVDKLENIQLSFCSCLGQIKKKNGKKQKIDTDTLTPKEEQQQKMKEEILAYLEIHYRDSDLSQGQVADLFRISNYTLSRLFKKQVGVGFTEYLIAKRLEYARELLLTTSYSVREVSNMAGFASENYFSRTFKLYEGMSPSAFRKK